MLYNLTYKEVIRSMYMKSRIIDGRVQSQGWRVMFNGRVSVQEGKVAEIEHSDDYTTIWRYLTPVHSLPRNHLKDSTCVDSYSSKLGLNYWLKAWSQAAVIKSIVELQEMGSHNSSLGYWWCVLKGWPWTLTLILFCFLAVTYYFFFFHMPV